MRRHLTLSEVKAALRRGSEVEQLIRFGEPVDGRATLTYVWLSGGLPVIGRLEHCFDDGSPSFFDVGEFQDVDDDAEDAWDPFSGPPPAWGTSSQQWFSPPHDQRAHGLPRDLQAIKFGEC